MPIAVAFACASNEPGDPEGPDLGVQHQPIIVQTADGCEFNNSDPESLKVYADKCDVAIGLSVPDFNCDNGSIVPTTNLTPMSSEYPDGTCDRPNVLNKKCDKNSKFQVLERTNDAIVVAHCRKKGGGGGVRDKWGDIAVIQYNNKTGATCFYQSQIQEGTVANPNLGIAGDPASLPSAVFRPGTPGFNSFPWLTPKQTADQNCVGCHDNGPFVRSPYLAQLSGDTSGTKGGNWLPGTRVGPGPWEKNSAGYWNEPLPYKFVGNDFQKWKAYSVTAAGSSCANCHRMGMSERDGLLQGGGTSQELGPFATRPTQPGKNAHSLASPIWMKPGQVYWASPDPNVPNPGPAVEADARKMAECADAFGKKSSNPAFPLPAGCSVSRFAQGDTCKTGPLSGVVNGETQAAISGDIDISGNPPPCLPGGCKPGFRYFTALHGPFWQINQVPMEDPSFRGSGARLFLTSTGAWDHRFVKRDNNTIAGPGGKWEETFFDELDGVTAEDNYGATFFNFTDSVGTTTSGNVLMAAGNPLASLTGLIGNVSQMRSSTTDYDYARIVLVPGVGGPRTRIWHQHTLTPNGGQTPPLVLGPLKIEALKVAFSSPNVQVTYLVQNLLVSGDSVLVPYPQSKKARCFITGVAGAWSSSRSANMVQPYAKIKVGTGGELRMEVLGALNDTDKVFAYASCVKLK
jgi:hypothetical protein